MDNLAILPRGDVYNKYSRSKDSALGYTEVKVMQSGVRATNPNKLCVIGKIRLRRYD